MSSSNAFPAVPTARGFSGAGSASVRYVWATTTDSVGLLHGKAPKKTDAEALGPAFGKDSGEKETKPAEKKGEKDSGTGEESPF